jgi:hypothetical protein
MNRYIKLIPFRPVALLFDIRIIRRNDLEISDPLPATSALSEHFQTQLLPCSVDP